MTTRRIPQEQVPILLAPHPSNGPWAVIPQFTLMDDDSIRCSGITIEWCPMLPAHEAGQSHLSEGDMLPWEDVAPGTAPPPEELTATIVRSIAITTQVTRARKSLRAMERLASAFDRWAANPAGSAHEEVVRPTFITDPARRRLKRLDDSHYDEVARVYREAPKYPRKMVAEHFKVSRAAASDYIEECRRRGLLPPTTKGRAAR